MQQWSNLLHTTIW